MELNALFVEIPENTLCPGRSQHNLNTKYADAADSMFKLMLTDPPLHIYLLTSTLTLLQPLENCFQRFRVEGQVW